MRVRFLAVGVVGLLLMGLPIPTVPQAGLIVTTPREPDGLKGLTGVCLVVEPLNDDLEQAGLHKADIRTDVQRKLQQAGIRVLTLQEGMGTTGMPLLYIHVLTHKNARVPLYAFAITVELKEDVALRRNPQIIVITATVWEVGQYAGLVGQDKIPELRDYVKDLVDEFCNAYLTANPKK
jgi:hypothetical protein